MTALVLVPSASVNGSTRTGGQLNLFPGSATPAVFAAEEPFWIGYGFVAEPTGATGSPEDAVGDGTRFELHVDGRAVHMQGEVDTDSGVAVRKVDIAEFPSGLPAGWHDFSGRWYERGRLLLSSRMAIQFVDA
jgi:hypothetical protein